jgi:heptosyltransferase-3
MPNFQKILVIKLRAIGDVILATPVLENLRQAFPPARIDFLTEKFCWPIVRGHPTLHEVLVLDRKQPGATRALIRHIRECHYDVVFDLFVNPRSALLTLLSGASTRVGFRFRGRQYAYNIKVEPRGDRVHEVEFNLDALRALQIPIVTRQPRRGFRAKFRGTFWRENNLQGRLVIGLNAPAVGTQTLYESLRNLAIACAAS